VRPDNNMAENAIRSFVVGRKNWLFSGSPRGARASAAIYSLIETAKANDLEPYQYLRHLFENIPQAKTAKGLKALLPMNLDRDSINNSSLKGGYFDAYFPDVIKELRSRYCQHFSVNSIKGTLLKGFPGLLLRRQ